MKIEYGNGNYLEWHIRDCVAGMQEMEAKSVDMILTDIPYNISQKSGGLRKLDYGEWDRQKGMEAVWIAEMERLVKGTIIVFCDKTQVSDLLKYLDSKKFITRVLIWHKPNPTVLNCNRIPVEATELAVYGKRPGATWNSKYCHNVFKYTAPTDRLHQTQKPDNLFKKLILLCSNTGDIVFDPFLGSGTTLRACRMTDRNGKGFEINQEYGKFIEKRIWVKDTSIEQWF